MLRNLRFTKLKDVLTSPIPGNLASLVVNVDGHPLTCVSQMLSKKSTIFTLG
jgi:hypothetical protein